jgi:hypothetical protein
LCYSVSFRVFATNYTPIDIVLVDLLLIGCVSDLTCDDMHQNARLIAGSTEAAQATRLTTCPLQTGAVQWSIPELPSPPMASGHHQKLPEIWLNLTAAPSYGISAPLTILSGIAFCGLAGYRKEPKDINPEENYVILAITQMEAGASRQDADMMVLASSVLSRGSSAM